MVKDTILPLHSSASVAFAHHSSRFQAARTGSPALFRTIAPKQDLAVNGSELSISINFKPILGGGHDTNRKEDSPPAVGH